MESVCNPGMTSIWRRDVYIKFRWKPWILLCEDVCHLSMESVCNTWMKFIWRLMIFLGSNLGPMLDEPRTYVISPWSCRYSWSEVDVETWSLHKVSMDSLDEVYMNTYVISVWEVYINEDSWYHSMKSVSNLYIKSRWNPWMKSVWTLM